MPARRENRSRTSSTARNDRSQNMQSRRQNQFEVFSAAHLTVDVDKKEFRAKFVPQTVAIQMDDGTVLEREFVFHRRHSNIYVELAREFSNREVYKYVFDDKGRYVADKCGAVTTKRLYENDIVGYCLSNGDTDDDDRGRAPWVYRKTSDIVR